MDAKRVLAYYLHVLTNIELKGNASNSYVMWVAGKTDVLNRELPPKIVAAKASLPDIDVDTIPEDREAIIAYITEKYGADNVLQIATYGSMKGREALTQVLKAHNYGNFEERKKITLGIPDEAAISDQLQEMYEETGEASVIGWCLSNLPKEFEEYCVLKEDGSLEGELAPYFAQAIRLEETKKTQSKHAAGVIIAGIPIGNISPLIYDKTNDKMMVALEFSDAEDTGLIKFDFLGVSSLAKIRGVMRTIKTGEVG